MKVLLNYVDHVICERAPQFFQFPSKLTERTMQQLPNSLTTNVSTLYFLIFLHSNEASNREASPKN